MQLKFQPHSPTSLQAAKQIYTRGETLRFQVLEYILECGTDGATDEEIQRALEMNPSTQRPRRIELVEAGLVVDSTRTRLTISGRSAVVWLSIIFI